MFLFHINVFGNCKYDGKRGKMREKRTIKNKKTKELKERKNNKHPIIIGTNKTNNKQ